MSKNHITGMIVLVCAIGLFAACGGGTKGLVYITVDTIDATLITVKFIEPQSNANYASNELSKSIGQTSAEGYTWHIFELSPDSYDVYIEWTGGIEFNGRAGINVDPEASPGQWHAVYVDAGGNTWSEEGTGTFFPGLYMYP